MPRRSLTEINAAREKVINRVFPSRKIDGGKQATEEQKSFIAGMYFGSRLTCKAISETLKIPLSSVKFIVNSYEINDTPRTLPRSGRPRKIEKRDERLSDKRTAVDFVEVVYDTCLEPYCYLQDEPTSMIPMEDGAPVHRSNIPK
ncbi:hypothetical protein BGZ80_005796 [Entomortierella chlamydospora]|uniref:Uncharacterized protein n=1 Tax=Entomortierella chlamydospora TaxID=101097 RepID=A0A9P6N0L6_9FUNG|nr:hypothetical protein BGZ80_005796 [Entomortierella chlamydospora]